MTPEQQAHYDECIRQGTSPALAEMFSLGISPGLMTDAVFMENRGGCYDQFEKNPFLGEWHARQARAAGINVGGSVYLSGLAAYPGDPRAWVSGRGDVKRVLDERGWGAEGAVSAQVRRVAEVTGGGVALDIVDREVAQALETTCQGLPAEEVREMVIEQRAPHWAKREV